MTEQLTVLFLPESAYGPTNQCIGLGDLLLKRGHRVVFASEASWAGKLAPLGFEERLVDLAAPDPDAGEEDAGQFWTDFIAETAPGVPQVHDRAADDVHPADLPGADRRCDVLRAGAAGDRRRGPPRRARRGQRGALPGAGDQRGAVRADRVVQPARGARAPASRRGSPGWPMDAPDTWAAVPRRVRPHPPGDVGGVQRLGAGAGRRAAARPGVHAARQRRQHLRLPRGGRLRRRPAARRHLAPDRLERAPHRRGVRRTCRGRRPSRRQRARLPLARLARRRRRRADAAAGRLAGRQPAPVHRQQGPAGRPRSRCPTTWSASGRCRRPRSSRRSTW